MQSQLDEQQIADARRLRAGGMGYAEIKAAIGADVELETIRGHCLDVPVAGETRTRQDKPIRQGAKRTIRSYSAEEDAEIIDWHSLSTVQNMASEDGVETMAGLAARLDRKRHSVAARIKTLKKMGRIPP